MYKIIGADGQEYGPVSAEQMREWIAEGRADARTQVQATGMTEWKTLATLPEFAALFSAPPPPAGPAVPPPSPPPAGPIPVAPVAVPNHLVWSILATVFCCLPFGIVAIVYAAQVNSKLQGGDIVGAMASSQKAKAWCWASLAGWVLSVLAYVLFMGLFFTRLSPRGFH